MNIWTKSPNPALTRAFVPVPAVHRSESAANRFSLWSLQSSGKCSDFCRCVVPARPFCEPWTLHWWEINSAEVACVDVSWALLKGPTDIPASASSLSATCQPHNDPWRSCWSYQFVWYVCWEWWKPTIMSILHLNVMSNRSCRLYQRFSHDIMLIPNRKHRNVHNVREPILSWNNEINEKIGILTA